MSHRIPVTADTSRDPLSRMRVYQLARELVADCFDDAKKIQAEPITAENASQLYAAVSSIEARQSSANPK